jgi:osmotically-inducible protein OsmY
MMIAKMYPLVLGALVATAACGRTNNAVGETRPDGAAVSRAAEVTNSSDNKEPAVDSQGASGTSGSAGTTGASATTGQATNQVIGAVGDDAMTAKVQAKFTADDVMKARRIDVTTRTGVVTLSGTVMSRAESDRAERLARETDAVKRVVNNLKINPTSS